MAKKSSNPVDAFRKFKRAQELKKNKEERKKVRETQTVKRDTRELESDIRHLRTQTDAASKTRLSELEAELKHVNSTKEKYVQDHPEARDQVFRQHRPRDQQREGQDGEGSSSTSAAAIKANLYDEEGRLRDPKKSVYYDAVYNPFGVPPPGMPYRERTPEEGSEEEEEDDDEENESDDEIIMPEGPPPEATKAGSSDSDSDGSDDSDDIPLPEGPPPPKPITHLPPGPVPPPMRMGFGGPPMPFRPPPRPVPLHAHGHPQAFGNLPGQGQGMPFAPGYGAGPSHFRPPVPRPLRQNMHHRPPPVMQDPLNDAPSQTYQGHRMAQHELPARPPGSGPLPPSDNHSFAAPAQGPGSSAATQTTGAGAGEISAAPVLRDLRKEATAFVPRGVKRKKVPGGSMINAAPGAGVIDADGDERKRVNSGGSGLMGKLEGLLGAAPAGGSAGATTTAATATAGAGKGGGDDDYQKFLDGLNDLS